MAYNYGKIGLKIGSFQRWQRENKPNFPWLGGTMDLTSTVPNITYQKNVLKMVTNDGGLTATAKYQK